MGRMTRRGMLVGAGLAATGLGCGGMNPFLLPYIFSGGQTKTPAEFPLAVQGKKTEARVVVVVTSNSGLPPDLAGVDRMLNAEIIRVLEARVKENEEKVSVLKMDVIDKFRANEPNWRGMHPYDLGKAVAPSPPDYVIDVEVQEMDLFKPGSRGQWLQGHAAVAVDVYDLNKPTRGPVYKQDFSFEFPQGQEVEVESRSQVGTFRMKFVQRIASDITVKFSASPPQSRMRTDGQFR